MVDPDDGAALESRPPLLEDLLKICRALNERGARYVVVGGMAVIHAGFVRATEDIDLLVDASADNFERIREALSVLPDQAVRDVQPTDLERYAVVRVADEVVVAVPVEARYASADQEFRKSHFRLFRDLYNITSHTVRFILARGDVMREYRNTRAPPPAIDGDA